MAGKNENLIPFDERTESERRELAKKAGQASGAARRRKKSMKAAAKMLLDMPVVSKELQQKMKLLGVPEGDSTYQMAVMVAMLNQAMKGNVKAAYFCRDTIGESPSDQLRRDELKLSKAKFEYEKAKDARTADAEQQKASLAEAIQAAYELRKERDGLTPSQEAGGAQTAEEGGQRQDD